MSGVELDGGQDGVTGRSSGVGNGSSNGGGSSVGDGGSNGGGSGVGDGRSNGGGSGVGEGGSNGGCSSVGDGWGVGVVEGRGVVGIIDGGRGSVGQGKTSRDNLSRPLANARLGGVVSLEEGSLGLNNLWGVHNRLGIVHGGNSQMGRSNGKVVA